MIVIGIIGAPAGGKSTVARRLREHGATWINADRIAHRCLGRPQVREQLVSRFGPKILRKDGEVDRSALGAIVFGDDAEGASALDYLESVIHPLVRHLTLIRLTRAGQCQLPAATLDAPLLLEADWGVMCDVVWCVDAPRELRERWIKQRGWTPEELRRRESRQLPISEKRRLSTDVIENDSDREMLLEKTDRLWSKLLAAEQGHHRSKKNTSETIKPSLIDEPSHCLKYLSQKTRL